MAWSIALVRRILHSNWGGFHLAQFAVSQRYPQRDTRLQLPFNYRINDSRTTKLLNDVTARKPLWQRL